MNPFNASAALMARLTYARKFLLLGFVLIAPALFALFSYWNVQGETIAFAESERAGVAFVAPANDLVLTVVAARSAAVRGEDVPTQRRRACGGRGGQGGRRGHRRGRGLEGDARGGARGHRVRARARSRRLRGVRGGGHVDARPGDQGG